ncbi:ankyrin repeat-containing domain protein [Aspergillus pseudoustus]|uniref:Ankyrin repeat-containing domain protein n=1 Tax=Aspergillus pseudoustus TaxID=1810923 RepID=A0ABR4KYN2_9EURO
MTPSPSSTLSSLPAEIILSIAENLDEEKDVNALTRTSRQFHAFFNDRLYQHNVQHNASSGLFWAATNNRKQAIELFLENSATLAHITSKNETPFMLAADAGHLSLLQWLLPQPGVDPAAIDKRGRTALTRACRNGHTEVVRFLLALETIDPTQEADGVMSAPLRLAADGGHADIFRLLLSTGKIDIIPELTLNSSTSLFRATARNQPSILRILVEDHGLDPNYADPERGMSIMHYAAINRCEAVIEYLLSVGANPDPVSTDPCTPFTHAVRSRSAGVVKLLMATGRVDVDFAESFNRVTPLATAAANGDVEIARELIESGRVDVNKKDLHGQTPLFRAAKDGRVSVVELLLAQEGILLESPDFKGERAFTAAIRGRHTKVVELFFKRDDIAWDIPNRHGESPLLVAASVNEETIVERLLDKGARIDCKDEHGRTPFAWAKWWQNEEMEKILGEYTVRQRFRRPMGVRDRIMLIEGQPVSPMVMLAEEIRGRRRVE